MRLANVIKNGQNITQEDVLGNYWYRRQQITLERILMIVCKTIGTNVLAVSGACKHPSLVDSRHLYSNFAIQQERWTLKAIGSIINRDHSTVIYGSKKIDDFLSSDKRIRSYYYQIEEMLNR